MASTKRVLNLLVPELPILVGAALLVGRPELQAAAEGLAAFYPWAVLAAALLLGLRFDRSRLVFAVALLGLTYWIVSQGVSSPDERLAFHAASVLLPLNLALVALLPERGTITAAGIVRWGMIAGQVLLVTFLGRAFPAEITAILKTRILPGTVVERTPVAQPGFVIFLATGVLLAVAWFREPQSPVRGYFFALVAAFLGFAASPGGPGPAIWFATSGLILVVAVIEASYLMAYRDGLTELPARRALNEALPRLGGQYTVAMVDVDHFKRFNDTYGHDAGDHVLRLVAARLARAAGGATAYRYGGEEFALVFPGKSAAECLPHLEDLRATIESSRFTMRRRFRPRAKPAAPKGRRTTREAIIITVSIGVAEKDHRHGSPEEVVRAADKALYRAKEAGRNRVST